MREKFWSKPHYITLTSNQKTSTNLSGNNSSSTVHLNNNEDESKSYTEEKFCEYEKIRLKNIEDRERMLQELQIKETKNENKAVVEKKTITKKMKLKSKASFPLRKSARLAKRSSADNLDMKLQEEENVAAAGDKTVNNNMMQLHEDLQLSSSEDEMDVDSFQIRKGIKLTKRRTSKEISSDHSDDITHNRMAELITNKSHEVHQLTLQVNCYKSMMKKYRDRAQALYKENSDLKRHIANIEAKSDFKITRAAAMRNGTRVNQ